VAIAPGTRLGSYELTGLIGVGGMGEVYRATDTSLKRQVAIKVLPASVAGDADRLARFQREAEVLASLNHPNIAAVYGLEENSGVRALVMELVEGPTLADRLLDGPLPVEEALLVAKQIADALEAAHERGIVHRDLKPANIKIRADGTVKVLDFGLAKPVEPVAALSPGASQSPTITTPAMTVMGVILGTAAYMSPEQARGKPLDRRADVWAFGCVLYEMLTGTRAFDEEDVSLTLSKVLQAEPDFAALPANVPARVRRTLHLCFRKPLRERMPDMGAVRLSLEGAFDEEDIFEQHASRTGLTFRRAVLLTLTAVAAALFGGVLVWRLMSPVSVPREVTRFALPTSDSIAPGGAGIGRHVLALSPQGTRLAYWADDTLHLRTMNTLDEAVIRGTEDAREAFFSPDGQWIGFHQDGQLKRVSVNGGAPIAIAPAQNPTGVSWGADGIIRYGQGFEGIWSVAGAGGTPSQLITLRKGEAAHGPQLLTGGEWVLFTLRPAGADTWDDAQIVAQSLTTGERTVVIDRGRDARYLPTGHLIYGNQGVLLAVPFDVRARRVTGAAVSLVDGVMDADVRTGAMHYTVSDAGHLVYLAGRSGERRTLVWVSRDGRLESLGTDPRTYSEPSVSPDGTQVAVDINGPEGTNIHIFDIARKGLTRLTSSPAAGRYPLWTPDGQRIVFYSDADGGGLFTKAITGTGDVERLTRTRDLQVPYAWSSDGRTLILEQRPTQRNSPGDLYVLPMDGKSSATPLMQTSMTDERQPALSPDGRWLAYAENEPGQATHVFVRPFPNVESNRWKISTEPGGSPLWARDGTELFFISRGRIMSAHIETQPAFRPGTPTAVFELPPRYSSSLVQIRRQWDMAPDGKRFLILGDSAVDGDGGRPQMVFVLNWLEELKRLVPTK
jgi:serine/threonine-protein kinase